MAEGNNIFPRNNEFLLGQNDAEEAFLRSWQHNAIHHAFLIHGAYGVGKATLAFRIARFLLWADSNNKNSYHNLTVPTNSNIFQQVANNSHPDLLVVERDYIETDRKKIISALRKGETLSDDDLAEMKKSSFIRVDDIRKINSFLSKTSFNDGWRVVIIDSADDMNKNAANALLKILEEPPAQTILLLVSHNPSMLLPTIRSRCAKLSCRSLEETEVASLLRRYRSQLSETEVKRLASMCNGSIGRAILYADKHAIDIYDRLCTVLYAKNSAQLTNLLAFCDEMSADAEVFSLLQELLNKFIIENISAVTNKDGLYDCWNIARQMFNDCANMNMDKRIMLVTLLNKIGAVL